MERGGARDIERENAVIRKRINNKYLIIIWIKERIKDQR